MSTDLSTEDRLAALERRVAALEQHWASPENPLAAHIPGPRQGYPVFDASTREVLAGEERPLHPLHSECACGLPVVKMTGDEAWMHC